MKLFVGLGNPGSKYAGHRHNVGFMALDKIATAHGFSSWRKRFQGETCEGVFDGNKTLLLKPATYMNDSGRAVGEAVRYLKLDLADVIVFYDEIDLSAGKLKVKTGGGNAGHNGLRSITHLVGNDYMRVRIGVGHPGHKELVAGYVLHNFSKADREWLDPLLDAICDASPRLASPQPARFLNDVSQSLRPAGGDGDGDGGGGKQSAPGHKTRKGRGKDTGQASTGEDTDKTHNKGTASARSTSSPRRQPASEQQSKRPNALTENLQKWLKGANKS